MLGSQAMDKPNKKPSIVILTNPSFSKTGVDVDVIANMEKST